MASWNCALKTSESSPNSKWQDGMDTRAHCTNTSCSQAFACLLHRTVMTLAATCSWKKAASSTTENYPPSTDGSSWRFSFRRCLESSAGVSSQDQTCTTVCMGPGLRLLRLKRQKSNHTGSPLFCTPGRCLLAWLSLPKCSLHKCEIITVSGIKNVNDECHASGRMIK